MKNPFLNYLTVISLLLFCASCDSGDSSDPEFAKVEIWLTDAPADFQEVNIDIHNILFMRNIDDQFGMTSREFEEKVYDVLKLTNGADALLLTIDIPTGKISEIRLELGNNNTLKAHDQVYDLSVASGQGIIRIQPNETFEAGVTYKILLDFDAARSIVQSANGRYILKPVIRTITEAQTGAVKGIIEPKEATPVIYAINGEDTVGTTYCDATGHFLLRGIPAGSYKISFAPNSDYLPVDKSVIIETGVVADVGAVEIPEN